MSQIATETSQVNFDLFTLPQGWRWVRLDEVCSFQHGGTPSKSNDDFWRGNIAWVSPKDMRSATIYDTVDHVSKEAIEHSSTRLVPAGTILVVIRSGILAHTLPVAIAGRPLSFNQDIKAVSITSDDLDPYFLFWVLKSQAPHIIKHGVKKGATVHSIRSGYLEALKFPLPPLPEQKNIAATLKEQMAAVERARAAAEAQLKAAKDLPAIYLRTIFDDVETKGWQFVKMGDISSLIIDGPHITPMYVPKGVPFVTVKNIVKRRVDLSQVSYITETDHAEFTRRGKAAKGDILYTKDGTLGIPCVVDTDEEFSFFVSVALIKLMRERADSRYVAYALESPAVLKQVESLGAGAGLKHMVLRSIRVLEIPLPSMQEQRKIAASLHEQMLQVEQTKKILQNQLDSINKLPAALLRQAFTGKL